MDGMHGNVHIVVVAVCVLMCKKGELSEFSMFMCCCNVWKISEMHDIMCVVVGAVWCV